MSLRDYKKGYPKHRDKENSTYTKKDFYRVIYTFHNSLDCRQTTIAKKLRVGESYTSNVLTRYFDLRMNLGELARDIKSIDRFVEICLEDDKNQKKVCS